MNDDRIRFSAQRYGSWAWLSFDLPATTDGPEFVHTGYEVMTATIAPEIGRRLAEDGRPLIEKWGTWIHVEVPGGRSWTGIVDDVKTQGAKLTFTAREWIGYLHGIECKTVIWGVQDDPADLARQLLAHVQSFPTGKLGATVVGSTPVRLGSDSEDKAIAARYARNLAKQAWETASKPRKALQARIKRESSPFDKQVRALKKQKRPLDDAYQAVVRQQKPKRDAYAALRKEQTRRRAVWEALVKAKAPASQIAAAKSSLDSMKSQIDAAKAACDALNPARDAAKAPVTAKNAQISAVTAQKELAIGSLKDDLEDLKAAEEPAKAALDAAEEKLRAAEEKQREDNGAYKIHSADRPDCWKALLDLARVAPFEFITRTERTTGAPKLTLEIRYPGVGRTRDDLVFESGRNVIGVPEVVEPDDYASEVTAAGAGQGETLSGHEHSLEATVAESDPRMRRTALYSDPAVTDKKVLTAIARADLKRRRAPLLVPELMVRDDPNCPIGAWNAGDIITVKLHDVPHRGRVVVKHRIKSWQRIGTHRARLKLEAV